tara:strand:+ start:207 stop:680 length:474 start_codon:yes stop_codon:yes gene_type:complete
VTTLRAVRLLTHYSLTGQRFFMSLGLGSTHVVGHASTYVEGKGTRICAPYATKYEGGGPLNESFQLAAPRADDHDPPLVTWPNWDLDRNTIRFENGSKWQRQAIGEYYTCARYVDAQVGALLDSLDALGLVTSTNVVIQGDHGFSLGRHSRWSKYSF